MGGMDDTAFQPGTDEQELDQHKDVLSGEGRPKMGTALLTNDRIVFHDQRYNSTAAMATGGPLAGIVASKLEKRRQKKGRDAVLDLPVSEITRVSHAKKLGSKNILVFEAGGKERRFNDGYSKWEPLLRRLLTERYGRSITQDGEDSWRVS